MRKLVGWILAAISGALFLIGAWSQFSSSEYSETGLAYTAQNSGLSGDMGASLLGALLPAIVAGYFSYRLLRHQRLEAPQRNPTHSPEEHLETMRENLLPLVKGKARLGITLSIEDGRTILAVSQGSPADSVGLVAGDSVTSINGFPTEDFSLNVLRMVGAAGTTVDLVVERNNTQQTFRVASRLLKNPLRCTAPTSSFVPRQAEW